MTSARGKQRSGRSPAAVRKQNGVALFVTIVLTTIMVIILGTITYRHELGKTRTISALTSEQAVLLTLSAESWAQSILKDDAQNNDIDSLEDDWAQVIPVLPVEGGAMTGCMVDMQSMYNINNLGTLSEQDYELALQDDPDDQISIYLNILDYVELDSTPERAAVVVDWIDRDSEWVVPGSAEDAEYSLEQPARLTANAPLTSLHELVTVYGYSLADIRVLDYLVTALPSATPINVNTAGAEVLIALSTLIDDFVVEGLIENRPYEDEEEFYEALEDEIGYMQLSDIKQQLPSDLFSVSSNYFELRAQVTLGGRDVALTSLFQRIGENEVITLSRSFQYIPDLIIEESDEDEEHPIRPLCDWASQSGLNEEGLEDE